MGREVPSTLDSLGSNAFTVLGNRTLDDSFIGRLKFLVVRIQNLIFAIQLRILLISLSCIVRALEHRQLCAHTQSSYSMQRLPKRRQESSQGEESGSYNSQAHVAKRITKSC